MAFTNGNGESQQTAHLDIQFYRFLRAENLFIHAASFLLRASFQKVCLGLNYWTFRVPYLVPRCKWAPVRERGEKGKALVEGERWLVGMEGGS